MNINYIMDKLKTWQLRTIFYIVLFIFVCGLSIILISTKGLAFVSTHGVTLSTCAGAAGQYQGIHFNVTNDRIWTNISKTGSDSSNIFKLYKQLTPTTGELVYSQAFIGDFVDVHSQNIKLNSSEKYFGVGVAVNTFCFGGTGGNVINNGVDFIEGIYSSNSGSTFSMDAVDYYTWLSIGTEDIPSLPFAINTTLVNFSIISSNTLSFYLNATNNNYQIYNCDFHINNTINETIEVNFSQTNLYFNNISGVFGYFPVNILCSNGIESASLGYTLIKAVINIPNPNQDQLDAINKLGEAISMLGGFFFFIIMFAVAIFGLIFSKNPFGHLVLISLLFLLLNLFPFILTTSNFISDADTLNIFKIACFWVSFAVLFFGFAWVFMTEFQQKPKKPDLYDNFYPQ